MVVDPPGVVELVPDGLGEADVQHAVAVQVADLAAPDPEAELPALARARLTPGQLVTSAVIRSLALMVVVVMPTVSARGGADTIGNWT